VQEEEEEEGSVRLLSRGLTFLARYSFPGFSLVFFCSRVLFVCVLL
jgi:hypothetical protein